MDDKIIPLFTDLDHDILVLLNGGLGQKVRKWSLKELSQFINVSDKEVKLSLKRLADADLILFGLVKKGALFFKKEKESRTFLEIARALRKHAYLKSSLD